MAELSRKKLTAAHYLAQTYARAAVLRQCKPGDRLLDFGCRSSSFASHMAEQGLVVSVHDRDSRCRQSQSGNAALAMVGLEWLDDPFVAVPFAAVTALWVLQHNALDEIDLLAQRLRGIIQPGGVLVYVASYSDGDGPVWQGPNVRSDPQWVLDRDSHERLVFRHFKVVSQSMFWYVHNSPEGDWTEEPHRANAVAAVLKKVV